MTPAPNPTITLIHIGPHGVVTINTNAENHKVLVTHSFAEFDKLPKFAFNPAPATLEALTEGEYVPQS